MENSLNNKINELYKTIEAKDNIINNQALEIARLNNEIKLRIKSIEKLENDIIEYQKKVKKLEEELDGNVTEAYENSEWWHNRFIGQQNANEILRNRINKTIEYIKEHSEMTDLQICGIENVLAFRGNLKELLEILGDKENE